MPAVRVHAGVIGAALADLAAAVDRDLPRLLGDQPQRGLLPLAELPADRVDQLGSRAGTASVSRCSISSWLAPAPSHA